MADSPTGSARHRASVLTLIVLGTLALAIGPGGAPRSAGSSPGALGAGDWAGIRAAYEARRHAVFALPGGFRARNPGQRWRVLFDGRGFGLEPDAGGWTWGLQLEAYGFAGRSCPVSEPERVSASGQRVDYDWDATLREWFVNDERGLEHGYTVRRRPRHDGPQPTGPLTFALAVRGELAAQAQADGRAVRFADEDGALLAYSGLSALDADGRRLPARLEARGRGLLLTVDERDARYPLTIDPLVQQAYLKASNTGEQDGFGGSVAVSGDTVVVGAEGEASQATGVDGDQSDDSAPDAGAAYVFVREGTTWTQQAYLKASNTERGDRFGVSVSVSGDTVVIGADGESSSANGVDGDQGDNGAALSGAAYVFARSGTSWSQQAYLKASNTAPGDHFGGFAPGGSASAVSVSGDTVVVGALGEDGDAHGADGLPLTDDDEADDSAPDAGAAYVFVRDGTRWSQQAYLKAANAEAGDAFGTSVSVSADTVVVGAQLEDSDANGVNGDQDDDGAPGSGAAYVFVRSGSSWSQQAYLKASNSGAGDVFGLVVSVSGETAVVGAVGEDSSATGVDGDQGDDGAVNSGAAYVFARSGTSWSQQAYLKASNTAALDLFGRSVAVSGPTAVVGAREEDSSATGVGGDQADDGTGDSGAAYVFVRSGTSWSQRAYLKASNTGASDLFGRSVAASGALIVVGAREEDSDATGVNGDQGNDDAVHAGAAYVFDLGHGAWTDLGQGLAGSSGAPLLVGTGPLTPGSLDQLDLSGATPSSPATLVFGLSQLGAPFKGGTLVPAPLLLVPLATNPSGALSLPFLWPASVPPGTALYFQVWIGDPGGVAGFAASNGLEGLSA